MYQLLVVSGTQMAYLMSTLCTSLERTHPSHSRDYARGSSTT
jgi:hypothetical protein